MEYTKHDAYVLFFSYEVQVGDYDDDGVTINANSLSLNGGSITDDATGNDARLDHSAASLSRSYLVDGGVWTSVTSVVISSDPGNDSTYEAGDVIEVTVTFSEDVSVTGTPGVELDIGGETRIAEYSSSEGSKARFSYTVAVGDNDKDGISIGADALNAAGITDPNGNDVAAGHAAVADNAGHQVSAPRRDYTPASVQFLGFDMNGPDDNDKVFRAGERITFYLWFTKFVRVTGSPQVTIVIGDETRAMEYTKHDAYVLFFSYEVQVGDYDNDGVTINANSLSLNGGSITDDEAGNDARLIHDGASLSPSYLVDGIRPTVTSVVISSDPGDDSTYEAGDAIEVTVTFSEKVSVSGTPGVELDIGGEARTAEYSSRDGAAVTFSYTVAVGDNDEDGISIGADKLMGQGIADRASNEPVASHPAVPDDSGHLVKALKLDNTPPHIRFFGGFYSDDGDRIFAAGERMSSSFVFSEFVVVTGKPQFTIDIGGETRTLEYVRYNGYAVYFAYEIQEGDYDDDGMRLIANSLTLNGGTITDEAGNDAQLGNSGSFIDPSFIVDGIRPTVTSVAISSDPGDDGAYEVDDVIEVTVTFDDEVTVTGTPGVELDIGGEARTAEYSSHDGSVVTFSYTVAVGDNDEDGISIGADKLMGQGIADRAGNEPVASHPAVPDDSGHLVKALPPDNTPPSITLFGGFATSESTDDDDKIFAVGERISFTFIFSESVVITGAPQFTIVIGDETRTAEYTRHNRYAVYFAYEVQEGDQDGDGITLNANSLSLNGGTITDEAGNDARLGHIGGQMDYRYVVDGIRPTVTSVAISSDPGSDGAYEVGDVIEVTVTFNENVSVTGTPGVELDIGGEARTAEYSSHDGSAVTFSYTVAVGDNDEDGISIGADKLMGEGITDVGGNDVVVAHDAVAADSGHTVFAPGGL